MNPRRAAADHHETVATAPESPFDLVLTALEQGANSHRELAARTGMSEDLVGAIVDHLQRAGMLTRDELAFGCPPSGCGGCSSAAGNGSGCDAGISDQGQGSRRPVLIVLSPTPPAGTGPVRRACGPE